MADTPPETKTIDFDAIDDPKELDDAVRKMRQAEPEPEPTTAPEAPAAEEPPKPVEPPPIAAKPERTETDVDRAWKRIRAMEKRLAQQDEELSNLRSRRTEAEPTAERPVLPSRDDDPVAYLEARAATAERKIEQTNESVQAELKRLREQSEVNDRLAQVRREEDVFEREHPDYRQAVTALENFEINEWRKSGKEQWDIAQIRQAVAAGKRGDSAFKGWADHVNGLAQRAEIQERAEKEGLEPEEAAIWLTARDTYLNARRELVRQGAQATGRNVAEIAYELAQERGYKNGAQPAQPDPAEAARQRVLNQKAITAAANSLSEAATAEGGNQPRILRSRNEVMNLSEDMLDKLIETRGYLDLPEK